MRRRREAPLSRILEIAPLVGQIEAERRRILIGRTRASIGRAPKELIASTIRARPCRRTTAAISSNGFRMPDVVSQWTMAT
jgi:hypothetical protein